MAHVAKHSKAACGHLFAHYDRGAEHIENEKIDPAKTPLNYNLAADIQPDRQGDFVKKRCSEVKCLNRKDVNVMCSWCVTAPKGLQPLEHGLFFETTFQFLCDRYGAENVVSAWVHKDETTDHMHFAFVPVFYDKKKDCYKVSAKDVVCRRDLKTFHQDLDAVMRKVFGRDIGVLNDETKEGNLTIKQLKAQQKKADELAKQNAVVEKKIDEVQEQLEVAQERLEAAQEQLEAYQKPLEVVQEYEAAKPVLGHYKAADVAQAVEKATAFDKLNAAFQDLLKRCDELLKQVAELTRQLREALAENKKLRRALEDAELTTDEKIMLAKAKSTEKENERLRKENAKLKDLLGVKEDKTRQR